MIRRYICIIFVGIAVMCILGACAADGGPTVGSPVDENPASGSAIGGSVKDMEDQESDHIAGSGLESLISEANETVLQEVEDTDGGQSEDVINEHDENVSSGMEERYRSILLSGEEFVNIDIADHHRKLSLENIREAVTGDDSIKAEATKFSIVDLDGNGENEIILWLQVNEISDYGYEVLYCQDMEVYGFTLTYRQFLEPKADGTFLTSGGTADTRICKLQLSESGYSIEEIFDIDMGDQDKKANVQWYDLTEVNVNENL